MQMELLKTAEKLKEYETEINHLKNQLSEKHKTDKELFIKISRLNQAERAGEQGKGENISRERLELAENNRDYALKELDAKKEGIKMLEVITGKQDQEQSDIHSSKMRLSNSENKKPQDIKSSEIIQKRKFPIEKENKAVQNISETQNTQLQQIEEINYVKRKVYGTEKNKELQLDDDDKEQILVLYKNDSLLNRIKMQIKSYEDLKKRLSQKIKSYVDLKRCLTQANLEENSSSVTFSPVKISSIIDLNKPSNTT